MRETGYALSVEETEAGIASVAVPIRVPGLEPASAISIASTSSRIARITDPGVIARLIEARNAIEASLAVTAD